MKTKSNQTDKTPHSLLFCEMLLMHITLGSRLESAGGVGGSSGASFPTPLGRILSQSGVCPGLGLMVPQSMSSSSGNSSCFRHRAGGGGRGQWPGSEEVRERT